MPNLSFGFLQMPIPRSCVRNLANIGSCSVFDKSATRIFSGSNLPPAPPDTIKGILLKRQCNINANLALTSSIQSKIKSGASAKISLIFSALR